MHKSFTCSVKRSILLANLDWEDTRFGESKGNGQLQAKRFTPSVREFKLSESPVKGRGGIVTMLTRLSWSHPDTCKRPRYGRRQRLLRNTSRLYQALGRRLRNRTGCSQVQTPDRAVEPGLYWAGVSCIIFKMNCCRRNQPHTTTSWSSTDG